MNSKNGCHDGFLPSASELTLGTAVGCCVGAVFGNPPSHPAPIDNRWLHSDPLRRWPSRRSQNMGEVRCFQRRDVRVCIPSPQVAHVRFFMSIGTVIRTEGLHEQRFVAWHRQHQTPVIIKDQSMDKWRDEYRRAATNEKKL